MNAVTPLEDALLHEVLAAFDVGTVQRYWPASNGIENSNYFVETFHQQRQHRYVLTIQEQQANAGVAYTPMMQLLEHAGLPVAPPLPDRHGNPQVTVADKPAMLQLCLPGKHVLNPTTAQLGGIGRFVARMHQAMQGTVINLPPYPRDAQWLSHSIDDLNDALPQSDRTLLQYACAIVTSLLARQDVQRLPTGMIHGDLFRDNVLFNERGLSGVLDFHHASAGYWLYDLAVIANDWCCDASGQLDPDRTTALLRAYSSERALSLEELWFFPTFALYAALAFWISRLLVRPRRGQPANRRHKDPDEFKRIVQQHIGHAFYLDARLVLDDL